MKIWTIGHSTRTIEEFISLLQINKIEHLVDVRSFPRSRMNSQFNIDSLPNALAKNHIQYTHFLTLGGRRGLIKEMQPSRNTEWEVQAFRNYADYALTEAFEQGLQGLIKIAKKSNTVIMCSEAVWWRCHRRIIADHLIVHGVRVFHIMSETSTIEAEMTEFAKRTKNMKVIYPMSHSKLDISSRVR